VTQTFHGSRFRVTAREHFGDRGERGWMRKKDGDFIRSRTSERVVDRSSQTITTLTRSVTSDEGKEETASRTTGRKEKLAKKGWSKRAEGGQPPSISKAYLITWCDMQKHLRGEYQAKRESVKFQTEPAGRRERRELMGGSVLTRALIDLRAAPAGVGAADGISAVRKPNRKR